jgi:hypothetical protein
VRSFGERWCCELCERRKRKRRSCGDEACWDRLGHGLEKAMTSFGSTDVCCIQHANAGGISRIAQHSVMVAFKFTLAELLAELLAGVVSVHVQAAGEHRGERPRACDRKSLIVKVVAGPRGSLPQSNHHPRPPLRSLTSDYNPMWLKSQNLTWRLRNLLDCNTFSSVPVYTGSTCMQKNTAADTTRVTQLRSNF